jgi:hypothetical protein
LADVVQLILLRIAFGLTGPGRFGRIFTATNSRPILLDLAEFLKQEKHKINTISLLFSYIYTAFAHPATLSSLNAECAPSGLLLDRFLDPKFPLFA